MLKQNRRFFSLPAISTVNGIFRINYFLKQNVTFWPSRLQKPSIKFLKLFWFVFKKRFSKLYTVTLSLNHMRYTKIDILKFLDFFCLKAFWLFFKSFRLLLLLFRKFFFVFLLFWMFLGVLVCLKKLHFFILSTCASTEGRSTCRTWSSARRQTWKQNWIFLKKWNNFNS